MRRKRTVATSPEGESSSSGAPSDTYAMNSPRSPVSQSTFDSFEANSLFGNGSATAGGSLSNVGSLVGHDDPTLVHANIVKSLSNGGAGVIKSSGTLESFLTEYNYDSNADESREYSTIYERNLTDHELRQQLSELDRTQEQWQAQQQAQRGTEEMDSTGNFYLNEVGSFRSSPRRRKSWSLNEQTIFEEETSEENVEESPREPFFDNHHRHKNKNNKNNDDGDDLDYCNEDDDLNTKNLVKKRTAKTDGAGALSSIPESASVASSVASSVENTAAESGASDLVFEYPSTDNSDQVNSGSAARNKGLILLSRSRDENESKQEEDDFLGSMEDNPPAETEEIVKQVQKRLYDLSVNRSTTPVGTGKERNEPSSDQRRAGFRSWIPVGDEAPEKSARLFARGGLATKSDLSDGGDDNNRDYYRRRRRLCCINVFLTLLIIAAIVCSVLFAVNMIGSKGNPSSLEGSASTTAPPIAPSGKPAESPMQNPSQTSPGGSPSNSSPVESPTEEPPAENPGEGPAVVIPTKPPPAEAPYAEPPVEIPSSVSPGESGSTNSPVFDSLPSPPMSGPSNIFDPTYIPTQLMPTAPLRPAEDRILDISGVAIYDSNTSQHEAFDWLLNDDPANLDVDNLSDRELEQRYIASLFYFSLDGSHWLDQYGFLGASDVCEWNNGSTGSIKGIICDDTGLITGFAINENNLRGMLPSEIQELTGITVLQLRTNRIQGTLSPGLGQLSGLQEIDLRENEIIGTIPEALFALPDMRQILLLRNSRLGGTIPLSIGSSTNLEMLSFQQCQISGTLPESLGNLSNLFFLTLMENELTGSIPESLTNLTKLKVLELSGNMLTGSMPSFFGQTELYFVSLFNNLLTGSIPTSLGTLQGLLFLDVHNNQLIGPIPTLLGTLPELVTFFAQNNQLTGSMPSFSGNKGLLQAINLSQNRLSGSLDSFFASGGPINRLLSVDLSGNRFTGSVPSMIGSFSELTDLLLDGNSLTGSIPVEIGFLHKLDTLAFRGNDLTGTIPEEMGLLEELVFLDLAKNKLVGSIPDTLIMLSYLGFLDLGSNLLEGTVPSTFGRLSTLEELYLNDNGLDGDLTSIFCPIPSLTSRPIGIFVADCLGPNPQVTCSCCTSCCNVNECLAN